MKKIYYIKSAILGIASLFLLTNCSENTMDKINEYNNFPLDAPAKSSVTDLLVSSAFNVAGGDLPLYSSIYIEHEAGVFGQSNNAERRVVEPTSSSTMNNTWESAYRNIKVAKLVIEKCSKGGAEEGSNITLAIAKVMLAYNTATLTDMFGDIPYFEAGLIDKQGLPVYKQPKVDKQEVVYAEVFKLLDDALVLFDLDDAGPLGAIGNNDYFYRGNGKAWQKVIYALKARYTMRLLNTYANKDVELRKVLEYVSKSFTSSTEEFKATFYDGSSQLNPLYSYSYSRYGLAASQSHVNKLVERNDPRATQIFLPCFARLEISDPISDITKLKAAPNGTATGSYDIYGTLITDFCPAAATLILSYHELLFLKAEAQARLGDAGAEETLKSAMVVAFANLEKSIINSYEEDWINSLPVNFDLSEEKVNTYFTASVKALYTANPLKEIMNQKYLSQVGANGESMEAYNDIRRMMGANENLVKLENPLNTGTQNKFPLRFVYGNSDGTANPNIKSLIGDGSYVYSENVWWAGGTR